jgi:colanic acid biosynthesis glycosyl transferase WcaI
MRNVLIVSSNFEPEPTGISLYTTDLAKLYSGNGFEVTILTTFPHYPMWRVSKFKSGIKRNETSISNILVHRVSHYVPKIHNLFSRACYEVSMLWNFKKELRNLQCEYDVVISVIPTLASGLIGQYVAKKFRVPFYLIIQDLSGLGVVQSGLTKSRTIGKWTAALENWIIRSSAKVVCVSEPMLKYIKMVQPTVDVSLIFNYSVQDISNVDKVIAREHCDFPQNKFLVIHTGNMGKKQGLTNVVKAAQLVLPDQDVMFVLVGHGNQEEELRTIARGCPNIIILPAVEKEDYPYVLNSADVLLVNEVRTQTDMSLPSKLTSYLQTNRTILAAVPSRGATAKFLEGKALIIQPEDPVEMLKSILSLKNDNEFLDSYNKSITNETKLPLDRNSSHANYLEWINS